MQGDFRLEPSLANLESTILEWHGGLRTLLTDRRRPCATCQADNSDATAMVISRQIPALKFSYTDNTCNQIGMACPASSSPTLDD